MDLFMTFLLIFLTLFAVKLYLTHQKTKEGFKFHRRKHNQAPQSSTKKHKKKKVQEEQHEEPNDALVENMDTPNPLDEMVKVVDEFEDLHQVYEENTTGYTGTLGTADGPIPEIPTIPSVEIDIPFPLDIITEPIQSIIDGFIEFVNMVIEVTNMIIDVIDIAIFYSICAFTLLINFFTVPCSFWYMLNLVTTVLYLPFAFIFWLIGITDIVEDYIWGPIYITDGVFFDYTGFHFAHFPDNILKGCYSCPAEFEVLGMSNFTWIGDMFKNSFSF